MSGHIKTKYEMLRAGYKFLSHAECKGCGAKIEWWRTNKGNKIPFNLLPEHEHERTTPHWATCPKRDDFRRRDQPAPAPAPAARIIDHAAATNQLLDSTGARIVIAVYDGGYAASVRHGIPAEDVRHELITTANQLRNAMAAKEEAR
jgi:hypothetical protein